MNLILRPQRRVSGRQSNTREHLRQLARVNNIPRGRDILDTIRNLVAAGYKV